MAALAARGLDYEVVAVFDVLRARVVGDEPEDQTPSGLWPSDHAGVAVKLEVRPRGGHW